MSMISEQVKKLREFSKYYSKTGFGFHRTDRILREAADTIEALSAKLSAEVMEYREIGTAEECREAVEKQRAKKPIRIDMCTCPKCGTYNELIKKRRNTVNQDIVYCWHCGQAMEVNRSDLENLRR